VQPEGIFIFGERPIAQNIPHVSHASGLGTPPCWRKAGRQTVQYLDAYDTEDVRGREAGGCKSEAGKRG
jgi:hypothetical protein